MCFLQAQCPSFAYIINPNPFLVDSNPYEVILGPSEPRAQAAYLHFLHSSTSNNPTHDNKHTL